MDVKDLLQAIREIILKETIYLRHYNGKVLNVFDPLNKGRVQVAIYEIGVGTAENGFWCFPRQENAMSLPNVGEWIDCWFVMGDPDRPVYGGKAMDIQEHEPKNFDGLSSTHVLFEDPDNKISLVFDSILNTLNIGKSNPQPSARLGDSVQVTIPAGAISVPATPYSNPPITVTGTITSGSSQIKVGA